jgi:NAD(P)-dependent dehydrogenase (short-subunit alcohol dehydrogenase family)
MTQLIALVTGADRGLGLALAAGLLERGWRVFAGRYLPDWHELDDLAARFGEQLTIVPLDVASFDSLQAAAQVVAERAGRLDLLINNAGIHTPGTRFAIREGLDYADIHHVIDVNSLGPLRVAQTFLPLLEQSEIKRLVFVSSEAGSVTRAQRTSWYSYCMSKAALNMSIKLMFNDLHPQGYTFRAYHPGWVRSYMSGKKNEQADLEPDEAARPALDFFLGGIAGQPSNYDEDQLVLVDYRGEIWPW